LHKGSDLSNYDCTRRDLNALEQVIKEEEEDHEPDGGNNHGSDNEELIGSFLFFVSFHSANGLRGLKGHQLGELRQSW
jgi:hypothetical protein